MMLQLTKSFGSQSGEGAPNKKLPAVTVEEYSTKPYNSAISRKLLESITP